MTEQRVTAKNALFAFYDIESTENVFTLSVYLPSIREAMVFYLMGDHPESELKSTSKIGVDLNLDALVAKIITRNPAFADYDTDGLAPSVHLYNLRELSSNLLLAKIMGLSNAESVNDPESVSRFDTNPEIVTGLATYRQELGGITSLRPVCDTDPDFNPLHKHPFITGFNSFNYDSVMAAIYLSETFNAIDGFKPVEPNVMRQHNDRLFSSEYKKSMTSYLYRVAGEDATRVRRAWLASGRHLDVSRLNEVMKMVALKRQLGGIGHQIMESEQVETDTVIKTITGFAELIAYNVSDCVGTHLTLQVTEYANDFDVKYDLLQRYPATIYTEKPGTYAPDVSPKNVRRDRLRPDSFSAQFVARVIAPYSDLDDMETVSLMYPSEKVARDRGIERYNVLERAKSFFYANVEDAQARQAIDEAFALYTAVEGRNFNDSERYNDTFPIEPFLNGLDPEELKRREESNDRRAVRSMADMPNFRNCVPYYRRDGSASSCYVNFSIGGIHGAEYNMECYKSDINSWRQDNSVLRQVQETYPNPLDAWQAKTITIDGKEYPTKTFLKSGTRLRDLKEMTERIQELGENPAPEAVAAIQEEYPKAGYRPVSDPPALFKEEAGKPLKLRSEYAYASVEECIHEDFTSYYPNMLRELSAFYNPLLGDDYYAALYFEKEELGRQMKEPGLDPVVKDALKVRRNSVKLLLNSASGAGDTAHYTPIRMNNTIISMRIIGQLFSWMIGQAQTFAGARIISTNTDGLYSVLDEETNNKVLEEMTQMINVDIEPEPLLVVSKDSNNRLEMAARDHGSVKRGDIVSASGSTLRCYKGPQVTSRLAHPAVMDYALVHYLRCVALGTTPPGGQRPVTLQEPMTHETARALMVQAIVEDDDPVHIARMFQNVLAASPTSISYVFAADPMSDEVSDEHDGKQLSNPRPLQNYNRVFIVREGTEDAVSLHWATAKKIPAATATSRSKNGRPRRTLDPVATEILAFKGHPLEGSDNAVPETHDVIVKKVNGIDASWSMRILNEDLYQCPPETLAELIASLDLDKYAQTLVSTFEKTWMNHAGEVSERSDTDEDSEQD